MCLTCGCMDAHLEMGKPNITYEDIKAAADENGRSVAETLDIMERTKAKDRKAHPQEYGAPVETFSLTSRNRLVTSTHRSRSSSQGA